MASRFALFTDAHYAARPPARDRWYADSVEKLRSMASVLRDEPLDFVIELGDLVDSRPGARGVRHRGSSNPPVEPGSDGDPEVADLVAIEGAYAALRRRRHYVLGNHDVSHRTKGAFRARTDAREAPYAFSHGGVRYVVLDACFRSDGRPCGVAPVDWTDASVPEEQLAWLEREISGGTGSAARAGAAGGATSGHVVFVHQRLDASTEYAVRNAADVRRVLEGADGPCLVLQGHAHLSAALEIGGVTYVTFEAMVDGPGAENASFAVVEIDDAFRVRVHGYGRQPSHDFDLSRRLRSTRVAPDRRTP